MGIEVLERSSGMIVVADFEKWLIWYKRAMRWLQYPDLLAMQVQLADIHIEVDLIYGTPDLVRFIILPLTGEAFRLEVYVLFVTRT